MGNVKFHTMRVLWGKLRALDKTLLNLKTYRIPRYGKLVSIDFPVYKNIFPIHGK